MERSPGKFLVTIAVPTLTAGPMLDSCLRALEAQTFRDFEVVVIDNGGLLHKSFGAGLTFALRVLQPGRNLGFAAAVNAGFASSSALFVAVLNDDAEPDPEWLGALLQGMELAPEIGMCASNIRMFDLPCIDSAGMLICFDGSSRQRGHFCADGSFPESEEVLFPSGCAALYRREVLDEVGGFDEDYFLYCEDTDMGLKARWAGWRCLYIAAAGVRHRYSGTAGAFSILKAQLVERNRLWVALKNFPISLLCRVPFVSVWRYLWQIVAVFRKKGAASGFVRAGNSPGVLAAILVRAHWQTLLALPHLLRKRAQVRNLRKITPGEFIRVLQRHRISAKEIASI